MGGSHGSGYPFLLKYMKLPSLQTELQKRARPIAFDPYRPFFVIGWGLAMAAVVPWLLLLYGFMETYPREMHADLMMGGFLMAFVMGFLGTALPRFTGTFGMERHEYYPLLLSLLCMPVAFVSRQGFYGVSICGMVSLLYFCVRRLKLRSSLPPPSFIFVIMGLIASVASLAVMSLQITAFEAIASLYIYQGQQLLFVMGVGIFLIPNLLGHPGCMPPISHPLGARKSSNYLLSVPKPIWVISALFLSSFFLQGKGWVWQGILIRTSILTLVAFRDWKIWRKPKVSSTLSYGLWLSCWFLVLGLWLQLIFPALDIHNRHLIYIGGFGVMTFMIATRVTLAHGDHDMSLEKKSFGFKAALLFLVLATATRSIARLLPEVAYLDHLKYAAFLWVMALGIWGWMMIPKCLKTESLYEKKL